MKKISLSFFFIFSFAFGKVDDVFAQINLQFSLDSTGIQTFYCADIGNHNNKYVFMNLVKNSFSLYNMDMTPFLTNVSIPVADSIKNGFKVIYVSRTLFDCDSNNIEYVYENPGDIKQAFRVFRTDGT